MLVLVDDKACMCRVVALQKLLHAVLDGIDTVLVVFDDHDDLCGNAAGESGVRYKHDRRCVDDDQVVPALEFLDQVAVALGSQ